LIVKHLRHLFRYLRIQIPVNNLCFRINRKRIRNIIKNLQVRSFNSILFHSAILSDALRYNRTHPSQIHINESIQNLKSSIDNLTQLIVHHQNTSPPTLSFLDRFLRFFNFFKSTDNQLNEECCQILQRHHLTKENLLHIYHLFDKNDTIFLNWLRTIMPEYFLPLLLNYVKNFHSISTDNS
jgi:hypothetical protein